MKQVVHSHKTMHTHPNIITVQNLWVKYNSTVALEDITLDIRQKEIVSIVGPNGSGKTTLIKTIMGFKQPSRGNISVLGKSPSAIMSAGAIGYLPQNAVYDTRFPVRAFDVVAMSCFAKKRFIERLTRRERKHVLAMLERVEMEKLANHHFGSLSSGQKQRILIARALAIDPVILILDEPATGLDAVAQDGFYHLLATLRDTEGFTIIMVSHDIGSVSLFSDTIACLNRKIHFHGTPAKCIESEKTLEAVFGKNVQFLFHDKNCETCTRRR
jgi:zinc transport system ATP-binding protein